jgi:hypothetical protein
MKAQIVGWIAVAVGAIGFVVPLVSLLDHSDLDIARTGIMISGSIVLGCGLIAAAIGLKK